MKGKTRVQLSVTKTNKEGEELLDYISKQIKKARGSMSARQLSKIIGHSESYIAKVETRQMEPSFMNIVAIARATGKPVAYFLPEKYRDKKGELEKVENQEKEEQEKRTMEEVKKLLAIRQ